MTYFSKQSNDKKACEGALNSVIKKLLSLDYMQDLISHDVKLLDIGSGDGCMALNLMEQLHANKKSVYVAVDRETKFQEAIQHRYNEANIPHVFFGNDFRKILKELSAIKCNLALVSHLYTTTPMQEFFPMVFSLLEENAVVIMAHDTAKGDASQFRSKLNQLQQCQNDTTKKAKKAMNEQQLFSITIPYQSILSFPQITVEEWHTLYQIKQADFNNTYEYYSSELLATKNLIDFIISDKLESFNDKERTQILDGIRTVLEQNKNQFKSTCKIQMVLSPKNTLDFKQQFIKLKETIELETSIAKKLTLGFLQTPAPSNFLNQGDDFSNKINTFLS